MTDAPTGTVSLVFSDIQGSTALWERLGDRFGDALALHDAVMRAVLAEHDGYEVKTEGDAFMIAFCSSVDAIGFCLAAQTRLHEADWSDLLLAQPECAVEGGLRGVRVRMGVHTGEPHARPDPVTGRMDHFGRMVNRAARVSGAGHGGQVLVSNAAWATAVGGLEADAFEVLDLGEHRLRGLARPEPLRQLLPRPFAARRFAPIKTDARAVGNLPPRATFSDEGIATFQTSTFSWYAVGLPAGADGIVDGSLPCLNQVGQVFADVWALDPVSADAPDLVFAVDIVEPGMQFQPLVGLFDHGDVSADSSSMDVDYEEVACTVPQPPETTCSAETFVDPPQGDLFLAVYAHNSVLCSAERVAYRLTTTAGGKPLGLTPYSSDREVLFNGNGDDDDSAGDDDDSSSEDDGDSSSDDDDSAADVR